MVRSQTFNHFELVRQFKGQVFGEVSRIRQNTHVLYGFEFFVLQVCSALANSFMTVASSFTVAVSLVATVAAESLPVVFAR